MTIDKTELKAIAEACKDRQPLRFMRSHGALYIRNDNGIVFDVHQNRSFPEFMAQNKDYADLALACTPATILALLGEIAELHEEIGGLKTVGSMQVKALKSLIFNARTSGGTAGPDEGLMKACEEGERAISLGAIGQAYMAGADAAMAEEQGHD